MCCLTVCAPLLPSGCRLGRRCSTTPIVRRPTRNHVRNSSLVSVVVGVYFCSTSIAKAIMQPDLPTTRRYGMHITTVGSWLATRGASYDRGSRCSPKQIWLMGLLVGESTHLSSGYNLFVFHYFISVLYLGHRVVHRVALSIYRRAVLFWFWRRAPRSRNFKIFRFTPNVACVTGVALTPFPRLLLMANLRAWRDSSRARCTRKFQNTKLVSPKDRR